MAATKINLTKLACTIIANAVRGRSYENFFTQKFIIRKFLYTKISRSTVYKWEGLLKIVWGGRNPLNSPPPGPVYHMYNYRYVSIRPRPALHACARISHLDISAWPMERGDQPVQHQVLAKWDLCL